MLTTLWGWGRDRVSVCWAESFFLFGKSRVSIKSGLVACFEPYLHCEICMFCLAGRHLAFRVKRAYLSQFMLGKNATNTSPFVCFCFVLFCVCFIFDRTFCRPCCILNSESLFICMQRRHHQNELVSSPTVIFQWPKGKKLQASAGLFDGNDTVNSHELP